MKNELTAPYFAGNYHGSSQRRGDGLRARYGLAGGQEHGALA